MYILPSGHTTWWITRVRIEGLHISCLYSIFQNTPVPFQRTMEIIKTAFKKYVIDFMCRSIHSKYVLMAIPLPPTANFPLFNGNSSPSVLTCKQMYWLRPLCSCNSEAGIHGCIIDNTQSISLSLAYIDWMHTIVHQYSDYRLLLLVILGLYLYWTFVIYKNLAIWIIHS